MEFTYDSSIKTASVLSILNFLETLKFCFFSLSKGPERPSGQQVWYLIIDSHLCVGLIPTSGNAENPPNMTLAVEWDVKNQA